MRRYERLSRGFTLIELLIVVAIIAILAAIAVPNFLEAQLRSKVARTLADCRTVAMAVQSYRIDCNKYPVPLSYYNRPAGDSSLHTLVRGCKELSTPVAYLSNVDFIDPFKPDLRGGVSVKWGWTYTQFQAPYLNYYNYGFWWGSQMSPYCPATAGCPAWTRPYTGFCIYSFGPDKDYSSSPDHVLGHIDKRNTPYLNSWADAIYDPSNGSISRGDIGYAVCEDSPRKPTGMFGSGR